MMLVGIIRNKAVMKEDVRKVLEKPTESISESWKPFGPSHSQKDHLQEGFQKLFGLNGIGDAKKALSSSDVEEDLATKFDDNNDNDSPDVALKTSVPSKAIEPMIPTDDKPKEQDCVEPPSTVPQERNSKKKGEKECRVPQSYAALRNEAYFMGLASVSMLCYCMAHLTIYELIHGLILEMTELRVHNFTLLYSGLLATSLFLMRSTGFLWFFLSSKHYRQRKAEVKLRGREGSKEERFQDWLEDRPRLKAALDVLGFYLCYISLSFFWNMFLECFFDQKEAIFKQLPSALQREKVLLSTAANGSTSGFTGLEGACEVETSLQDEDYEFIYGKVAKMSYYQYSGNLEAPLFSASTAFIVYMGAGALSVCLLSQTGLSFEDNW